VFIYREFIILNNKGLTRRVALPQSWTLHRCINWNRKPVLKIPYRFQANFIPNPCNQYEERKEIKGNNITMHIKYLDLYPHIRATIKMIYKDKL
jgi:hypothetical protein